MPQNAITPAFDEQRFLSAYYVRQTDRGRVRRNQWPGGFFVWQGHIANRFARSGRNAPWSHLK